MKEYMIKVDCYSPDLKVKSDPEDAGMVKKLYDDLLSRFEGIDDILKRCKAEKVEITITKNGVQNED